MAPTSLSGVDLLMSAALRIAASAPTGRIGLARFAESIDTAWIGEPWGRELVAQLEAARAATADTVEPAKAVERTLREAWGARPTDELDELDLDPVAVTPTAQVHRGVLDGRPVAVKVLRRGLASAVRQDLMLLDALARPLAGAFPALDAAAVLGEARARILEELDLEHEAAVQRTFHRALRDHPTLVVPAPVMRLAHERVLVSDWIDGVPIAAAADRDRAAARLVVFVVGAARHGIVHADPQLDDALVLSDGRLAIVDFGATRRVAPDRADLAAAALDAFAARDPAALGRAVEELGWLPAAAAGDLLGLATRVLGTLAEAGPSRLDSAIVVAARDRLLRDDALARLLSIGSLPPEDLLPARSIAQLLGVVARVGATGDWVGLARAAARDGWDAARGI